MRRILVTGGLGFIGSNFIRKWLSRYPNDMIINVDKCTYAGNRYNLPKVTHDQYRELLVDICDQHEISAALNDYMPSMLFNFAAETHVDNSIMSSMPFVTTNVLGTANLLECSRKFIESNPGHRFKFIHISTDEVYGSYKAGSANENSVYDPNSPYAASKAASDHFVQAYNRTYGLRTIVTHCCNNYGPRQHREKLIPTIIRHAINNEPVPIYGTGMNVREWIHVDDHNDAVIAIAEQGANIGDSYCIGSGCETTNLWLAEMILGMLDKPESLIQLVDDRKGHDWRYSIDSTVLREELFWDTNIEFADGIADTVKWYLNNQDRL